MLNICIICNDNVTNLHDDIDYVTESESDEDWLVTIHQEAALGWSVLQEQGSCLDRKWNCCWHNNYDDDNENETAINLHITKLILCACFVWSSY